MFIKLFYKKSGISHIVNIVLSVLPFCHCQNMMQTSCPAICFQFQIISMLKDKVTSDISIFQISFLHILEYFFGFRFFPPTSCFIILPVSWQRTHNSWISWTEGKEYTPIFVPSCVSNRLSVLLFKCKNTKLVFMFSTFFCCSIELWHEWWQQNTFDLFLF